MSHPTTDLPAKQSTAANEQMDFFDLGGEQVYYALHRAQNPSAQILLAGHFVTERPFSYALWVRWARHLASRGVSALRFDYRGCGESTGEFHHFTLASWLEDCRAMIGLLKAQNPKLPVVLGGIGMGGLLASLLFAEGQGDGMLLWSPAANGAGALRDTLLRRLAFDLANPTTGQPKTWADYETSLQQGESIEAAGYTLSAALWREAVAMKLILPGGGRDQGADSRGRPWKVVKLGQAHVPLIPGGGLWQAINPGLRVRRAPLSPDLSGFFEENCVWIRSNFSGSTATS
jgi:pimeloyl-ACP methyl ester carboxylesterase